jgi:hypothetical protein
MLPPSGEVAGACTSAEVAPPARASLNWLRRALDRYCKLVHDAAQPDNVTDMAAIRDVDRRIGACEVGRMTTQRDALAHCID